MSEFPNFPPPYQRTTVIGLGHKARQGKDTAVKHLQAALPGRVFRVAFADALKAVARSEAGMTAKDAPLLQRMGVERRTFDPWHWVRIAAWTIAELDADATAPQIVCVPDVRFPNEASWVEAVGGENWCIRRVREDLSQVIDPGRPADHPSELALKDWLWDEVFFNPDGKPEVLEWMVHREAERLARRYLYMTTPAEAGAVSKE